MEGVTIHYQPGVWSSLSATDVRRLPETSVFEVDTVP
jgi:hypothetical protein